MYLLAKFGGHRFYRNKDINSCNNVCRNTSEKAEVTAFISHIENISKSGIPIYNSVVLGKMGRRIEAIAKRYAFLLCMFVVN